MPRQTPADDRPDPDHRRPDGADDATIAAAGKVGEAFEWVIRARGSLYAFHQQMGRADLVLGEALDALREAGHADLADELDRTWLGRNALTDRWTFQIVEDFDATYFDTAEAGMRQVRDQLTGGSAHVHEAEMKADRRRSGPTDDR